MHQLVCCCCRNPAWYSLLSSFGVLWGCLLHQRNYAYLSADAVWGGWSVDLEASAATVAAAESLPMVLLAVEVADLLQLLSSATAAAAAEVLGLVPAVAADFVPRMN